LNVCGTRRGEQALEHLGAQDCVGVQTLPAAPDGRTLANALAEGADRAWVGTRFAVCNESFAHSEPYAMPKFSVIIPDPRINRRLRRDVPARRRGERREDGGALPTI